MPEVMRFLGELFNVHTTYPKVFVQKYKFGAKSTDELLKIFGESVHVVIQQWCSWYGSKTNILMLSASSRRIRQQRLLK